MTKKEYILLNWYPSLPFAWNNNPEVRITQNAKGNYTGDADGIPHYLSRAEVENNPVFWVEVRKRTYVDDIIDEPSRAFKPKEPQPYEVHQRRGDFLLKFNKSTEMYNHSPAFRRITEEVAHGADFFEIISTLFLPGKTISEIMEEYRNETK